MVLRHVALLHERVLPRRTATTRSTGGRARARTIVRQAYGGTYTYDNNGRVDVGHHRQAEVPGWYAYQYKVDPHWLIRSPVRRRKRRASRPGTRSSRRQVDLHGDQQTAVRGWRRGGREPGHDLTTCRSDGPASPSPSRAAPAGQHRRRTAGDLPRPDRLRLRRPSAVADVHRRR